MSLLLHLPFLLLLYTLLKPFLRITLAIYHHFRPLNLKAVYGQGWAIVTGATDGIGFGFCQELAGQGYNVCLVSRSQEKLQAKVEELRREFGDRIQYKTIRADFTQSHNKDFFPSLTAQLEKITPKILVNNVGIAQITKIADQEISSMCDIISVNCLPMSALSSYMIARSQKANHKAGIINLSSSSWLSPMPYMSVYAATKAYNDTLSRSCALQAPNMDILSVRPMMVISAGVKRQKGLIVPTSRECARDSLRYLGRASFTAGHLKHEIVAAVLEALPGVLLEAIARDQAERVYRDCRKKQK